MVTIEQIGEVLQEVLTDKARQAGRESGFIQRERKLDGASFTQTLVFGWMANPEASLEELAQAAVTCGVEISAQGLDSRFSAEAAKCLKQVLEAGLSYLLESDGSRSDILSRFQGVYLQDSTVIGLPVELGTVWAGCGNQHGSSAGLKVHTLLDYQHGRLSFSLHPATQNDGPLQCLDLPSGALSLADIAYFEVGRLKHLSAEGVFWLTRLASNVCLQDEQGNSLSLLECFNRHAVDGCFDAWIGLTTKGLPARLLAQQVPAEVAAQRQAQLLADAQRRGRSVSPQSWALCHWNFCATNLDASHLSLHEAFVLLRVRWQIELLFKLWKSQFSLSRWRTANPWRVLCEVYAKLLIVLIQHWFLLLGCWHLPQRSLAKASHTIRKHAFHLACVLSDPARLLAALLSLTRSLSHCRVQKRKTCPATFQRLASLSP